MSDTAVITFPDSSVKSWKDTPFELPPMRKSPEVAAALNMTPSGFLRMVKRGNGPAYTKLGRQMRFADADVFAWLASKRSA